MGYYKKKKNLLLAVFSEGQDSYNITGLSSVWCCFIHILNSALSLLLLPCL